MATGIGSGLNQMATSLFITTNEGTTTLSTFGGIVAVFGGIALAVRGLNNISNKMDHEFRRKKLIFFLLCGFS